MNKAIKVIITARIIIIKLLPVILAIVCMLFIYAAVDRFNIRNAPGEKFVNYTSFTVQNAREGENVNLTVCRDHESNYNFTGNLTIRVISVVDNKPRQVYATDIHGEISNECDNKQVLAKDYHHTPNSYVMAFCIDFKVKYDITKTVCKTSNRYTVYAQPNSFSEKITLLENELAELRAREQDSVATRSTGTTSYVQNGSLSTNDESSSPTSPPAAQNPTPAPSNPPVANPPAQNTTTVEKCAINALDLIKVGCRQVQVPVS